MRESKRARCILLALSASECPQATLLRAQSLSLLLDAELHVLRVVPLLASRRYLLGPRVRRAEAIKNLTELLDARRKTRLLLSAGLGNEVCRGRFKLRAGDFFEQVSAHAQELSASLILLSPPGSGIGRGRKVTRLARSSGVPVLVAREAGANEAIIAATDLRSQGVPVLDGAAELSQRLGAPLIAVHNVDPSPLAAGPEIAVQLPAPAESAVGNRRKQRLLDAARDLGVESEAVLKHELDPTQAVLDLARARSADLVVVGTRGRSWLERLARRNVSARIVTCARCSVLVTPITSEPVANERLVHAEDEVVA